MDVTPPPTTHRISPQNHSVLKSPLSIINHLLPSSPCRLKRRRSFPPSTRESSSLFRITNTLRNKKRIAKKTVLDIINLDKLLLTSEVIIKRRKREETEELAVLMERVQVREEVHHAPFRETMELDN
jgi:hypothetical protein